MNKFNIEPNELYHCFKEFQNTGCGGVYFEDKEYDGRSIHINSKKLLNMANCSYLGLEKHPFLIESAIEAIRLYGTQNSVSRSLFSSPLFIELENNLKEIFNGYPIVYGSTTLAHYAALPLLAKENDALILDAFVHNSVRTASQVCKSNGAFVIVTRHNDMEYLRYMVKRLKKEGYKKIWYCADGIYSIHGDLCNVKALNQLLDEEENFYAYVDDAHGIGWCGKNGCGYVIGNYGLHNKMIVAGSLSKSVAAAGGFLIVPDKNLADYLKLTGHTFIFSIPMPPASLGAITASLKLHLSDEIIQYQKELRDLILYFKKTCKDLSIPVETEDVTPIQLIKLGENETVLKVQKALNNEGYFTSSAIYPAVNKGEGGLRISLTRHLTNNDIDNFLSCLKRIYPAFNHELKVI